MKTPLYVILLATAFSMFVYADDGVSGSSDESEGTTSILVIGVVINPGQFSIRGKEPNLLDAWKVSGGPTRQFGSYIHLYRKKEIGDSEPTVIDIRPMMEEVRKGLAEDLRPALSRIKLSEGDIVFFEQRKCF